MIAKREGVITARGSSTAQRQGQAPTRWALLGLTACLVLPLVTLAFSRVMIIDDAYISLRYAHNLAVGNGLVFNPGEHVEGFTNLLWTLIMTVPIVLHLPVDVSAVALGGGFGILALVQAWFLCRRLWVSPPAAALAIAILGLDQDYWLTVTNGLEGGLFSFLLVRTVSLALSPQRSYSVGVYGGLLFATRPESIMVVPLCALYLLLRDGADRARLRQRLRQHLVPLLIPWLALVVAITLWRLGYYGAWLPNSITAKAVPLTLGNVQLNGEKGSVYLLRFLLLSSPLAFGALFARRSPATWLCLSVVAWEAMVSVLNGGDWMPHYRLLAVYAPVLAIPFATAIERFASIPARACAFRVTAIWFARWFFLGWFVVSTVPIFWNSAPHLAIAQEETCYQRVAERLKPILRSTDKVSPDAVGLFSYTLPHTYIHDMLGLTDAHVARYGRDYLPTFGKYDPFYTADVVHPAVMIVHTSIYALESMERVTHGRFDQDYSTYALEQPSACSMPRVVMSVRRDSADRLLPVLAAFKPKLIAVPSR